mmetsp:Transcript_5560/g.20250  ORF Transcript_5560/g.20250 Transcript_5560/m.20250 type:complete len:454 (-) Transcript_5560:139-1500(-)
MATARVNIGPLASKSVLQGSRSRPQSKAVRKHNALVVKAESAPVAEEGFDARAFRRSLNSSGRYIRRTTNDEDSVSLMDEHGVGYSRSGLVAQMREEGNLYKRGDITVLLADSYGFCWGVERAVQMAYEARKRFPEKKLWITNEIIHNPTVNERLASMDVGFVEVVDGEKDFSGINKGEVVILPAFGASVDEMVLLNDREVEIIDTTCPWVSKVWNSVDVHKKKEYTSIIHGKYAHEETVATASFAGTYLIVKDMKQAEYVCNYILNGGDREEFLEMFKNAYSEGFDPDTDLEALGIANQTTMLKGETEMIGKTFEKTMLEKFGPQDLKSHFLIMDTICDATQERQDAMYSLVEADVDMMMVVGGFNSSNTSHLQEIAEDKNIPSYWVDSFDRIDTTSNSLLHKTAHGELLETKGWLKPGPVTIGITSGASTPDKVVEDVLDSIFKIHDGLEA